MDTKFVQFTYLTMMLRSFFIFYPVFVTIGKKKLEAQKYFHCLIIYCLNQVSTVRKFCFLQSLEVVVNFSF